MAGPGPDNGGQKAKGGALIWGLGVGLHPPPGKVKNSGISVFLFALPAGSKTRPPFLLLTENLLHEIQKRVDLVLGHAPDEVEHTR